MTPIGHTISIIALPLMSVTLTHLTFPSAFPTTCPSSPGVFSIVMPDTSKLFVAVLFAERLSTLRLLITALFAERLSVLKFSAMFDISVSILLFTLLKLLPTSLKLLFTSLKLLSTLLKFALTTSIAFFTP